MDGKEAYEKMLNISFHQGNEHLNHNEIPLQEELSFIDGGNAKWHNHFGRQFGSFL